MTINIVVRKLLVLDFSCIYPRLAPQPMRGEYLMGSKVRLINERYEILKIVDMKLFKMYNIWHRLYKWNVM